MQVDINILIAIIGGCISVAAYLFGRQSAAKTEGEKDGAWATDLKYIKDSIERIENSLNDNVKRLEGRIDEISVQITTVTGTAVKAHESAKSGHKRLDEHLQRTHGQTVVRRDE